MKVIKQKNEDDLGVSTHIGGDVIIYQYIRNIEVEKENTRELALSICPELAEEIERLKAVDPIKFLHWVRENDFVYSGGAGWYKDEFDIVIVNALTYITDEQLLNLYFEQLKSK